MSLAQSGMTRRKGGGSDTATNGTAVSAADSSSRLTSGLRQRTIASPSSSDLTNSKSTNAEKPKTFAAPKLTLLEEVLLLGLKDVEGHLSFWNDSLSYVLRGCILIELALRKRIKIFRDHYTVVTNIVDRPLEVISSAPTGELLLDETLRVLKNTDKNRSTLSWMDLLSGETWNLSKAGFQLKQVRERLLKGLVDKGVLRTEKKNFVFFDMATHPIHDYKAKAETIYRLFDTLSLPRSAALVGRPTSNGLTSSFNYAPIAIGPNGLNARVRMTPLENPKYYQGEEKMMFSLLRRVSLTCAAVAANVLENPLIHLDIETRDYAFMRAEELLNIYGHWPYLKDQQIFSDTSESDPSSMQIEEVVSAVLCVFRKMDKVI